MIFLSSMFWKKEEPKRFLKLVVLPSIQDIVSWMGTHKEKSYPGYKDENMEKAERLAFHKDVQELDSKINLILDHLNLEYVPESEKKKPAKLVEKKSFKLPEGFGSILNNISGASGTLESSWTLDMAEIGVPPKKKRGRPKKKK